MDRRRYDSFDPRPPPPPPPPLPPPPPFAPNHFQHQHHHHHQHHLPPPPFPAPPPQIHPRDFDRRPGPPPPFDRRHEFPPPHLRLDAPPPRRIDEPPPHPMHHRPGRGDPFAMDEPMHHHNPNSRIRSDWEQQEVRGRKRLRPLRDPDSVIEIDPRRGRMDLDPVIEIDPRRVRLEPWDERKLRHREDYHHDEFEFGMSSAASPVHRFDYAPVAPPPQLMPNRENRERGRDDFAQFEPSIPNNRLRERDDFDFNSRGGVGEDNFQYEPTNRMRGGEEAQLSQRRHSPVPSFCSANQAYSTPAVHEDTCENFDYEGVGRRNRVPEPLLSERHASPSPSIRSANHSYSKPAVRNEIIENCDYEGGGRGNRVLGPLFERHTSPSPSFRSANHSYSKLAVRGEIIENCDYEGGGRGNRVLGPLLSERHASPSPSFRSANHSYSKLAGRDETIEKCDYEASNRRSRVPEPTLSERRSSPSASFRSASHSYSKLEAREESIDNRDYEENRFGGSRGQRAPSGTPKKQKPSVLSRIHSGKSVWDRIEERPAFMPSPTPTSMLPPSSLDHQVEMGALDLSYKSDSLVARAVESSSTAGPSSQGKDPTALKPLVKKKKIKKKIIVKRRRVVIPIVTDSRSPTSIKRTPSEPISTSVDQGTDQMVVSQEAIVPSSEAASTVSPQPCLKRAVKFSFVGKNKGKKYAKKIVMEENVLTDSALEEDKIAAVNEESKKYADALLSEISSQLFRQGSPVVEKIGEQSVEADRTVQANDVNDSREDACVALNGKPGSNCADLFCSVMEVENNVSLTSPENATFDLVDNEVIVEHGEQSSQRGEDAVNTTDSDIKLSPPPIRESPILFSGDKAQVISVGSLSFSRIGDSPKGKRGKRKREEKEKHHKVGVGRVTEALEILGGRQSELGDPCFDLNVSDTQTDLKDDMEVADRDETSLDGPKDDDDNVLDMETTEESESDCVRLGQEKLGVPMIYSMGAQMEQPLLFEHSKVNSLAAVFKVQDLSHLMCAGQSQPQLSGSKGTNNDCYVNNQDTLPSHSLLESETKKVESLKSTLHLPQKVQAKQMLVDKKVAGEEPVRKINATSSVPRVVPTHVTLAGPTRGPVRLARTVRNKTWHRNDTPSSDTVSHGNLQGPGGSSMQKQSQKKIGQPPNSYIRKGNCLVLKPAAEVHPLKQAHDLGASNRLSRHAMNRSTVGEIKVERKDSATSSNPLSERLKTPPLPTASKQTIITKNPPPSDFSCPILEDPNSEVDDETRIGHVENQAIDLLSGTLENQNSTISRQSEPSKTQNMVYVKHKSNQLVAAPRPEPGDLCTRPTDNTQVLPSSSSDHYYRRKKNQLVRNASTSDIQQKQNAITSFDNSISDDQRISTVSAMKNSMGTKFMKRLGKVLQKTYKHPKLSRVWTLSGEKSDSKAVTSSNCWKVLPHLFPWKRTIYQRNSNTNPVTMSRSLFSRKLQHTRRRNTIYKVSTNGFSLRKTAVVSIGGASLKWSKSIEKHSKKASKEATLAVVEADRKKREMQLSSLGTKGKSRRFLPRERIFRIGSARYKMDSSRRTLVRIPDEQSSSVVDQQSGNSRRSSCVPRRLLIGNDEYIRIGNGHKLVRDPKKLVRIWASEKVRWSLHTARLRVARKHQYCQFFTRFGKCSKNGGKCPYIHDPAKIAICTKFIRGLCSDTNCKLTHKVIPERMQDCSYFLQALCTNANCPYRHVHVNPKAPVCEGFLKGYCADGDECRKKHSYACPSFEATGKCPQGSKCKLHHPMPKNKSKKEEVTVVQSSSHGRYFGCSILEAREPLIVTSDKHDRENAGDLFYSDGLFPDYIPLDTGIDGNVEVDVLMDSQQTQCTSEPSEMQQFDLDALIKPVLIMKKANIEHPSAGPLY